MNIISAQMKETISSSNNNNNMFFRLSASTPSSSLQFRETSSLKITVFVNVVAADALIKVDRPKLIFYIHKGGFVSLMLKSKEFEVSGRF